MSNKKDLLIGNTSQLAYYWPKENTEIISSRNVDIDYITSKKWNRIYIAFADGRTFLSNYNDFYYINVSYTSNLIDKIKECCKNVIYYSTTELWSSCENTISLNHKGYQNIAASFWFDKYSNYINSKAIITDRLLTDEIYKNVIVLFPFSFNSPIRKEDGFLFSKIFKSIINKERIKTGNTHFYRELLHPKFVIEQSLKAKTHQIIGSGRVVYVYDFIKDLYNAFDMKYEDFVDEENAFNRERKNIFYLDSKECLYSYEQLLKDTVDDINGILQRNK